jgi:prolyl-tRNA synthetase
LGLKVLKKIENIVRKEMDATGALEILMPAIQPSNLWEETGRWNEYGNLLLKMSDRHDRLFCFGPTHEEVITDIVRSELNTYKQLPVNFYQIQTKFRDEIRPRFGVMRAREFLMKDSYSFHLDQSSLDEEYKKIGHAYDNIFMQLGLNYRKVRADSGEIGGSTSHEYHVLAEAGEDKIGYCDEEDFAANVETINGDTAPGGGELSYARGIEVGHIFQLGDKYSKSMKCSVLDNTGKSVHLMMGCYGIGISRIVAASIEQNHDKSGIIWPKEIAPFEIIIIAITKKDDETVLLKSNQIYNDFIKLGYEVALDDRSERAGVKFAEAELIGIPYQIIVSERGLNNNTIELVERGKDGNQDISIDAIKSYFENK